MTSLRSPRTLLRVLLVSAVMLMAFASPSAASVSTLYAATGSGCSASDLYTLDGSDGSVLTGPTPITVDSNQVFHVTGLAVRPSDGTLFGLMNYNPDTSQCFDRAGGTLVTINKATGVATVVGSPNSLDIQGADLTFDANGNLYAITGCNDDDCNDWVDVFKINTTTGTSSKVGELVDGFWGRNGIASDSKGRTYYKNANSLYRMNQFTGHSFSRVSLGNNTPDNILAFSPTDVLYTGDRAGSGFQLQTLNPTTGAVSNVGAPNGVFNVSTIEWESTSPPSPPKVDLSVTNNVDNATPTAGNNVVFTIAVTNAASPGGTASAVKVKDVLPSGFAYVSHVAGTGTYDSSSGMWDVGSLGPANQATLEITATALAGGIHTNTAEVVETTSFDIDSVPGSEEGDTFASRMSKPSASAALYGLSGATGPGFGNSCGGSPSALYELDPSNNGVRKVADITAGGAEQLHFTGLAVRRSDGALFGFRNTNDPNCPDWGTGTLLSIDKSTGAATVVGSPGLAGIQVPDMSFDPFGTLYAWGSVNAANTEFDDLYTLDTGLGTSGMVGECFCGSSRTGFSVDSLGRMYEKDSSSLYRVNQFTGQLFSPVALSNSNHHNMLTFGPSNTLYTGQRTTTTVLGNNIPGGFQLKTINQSTGSISNVGSVNGVISMSALAWDLGSAFAEPDEADLRISKTAIPTSPENWGDHVTFTITVTNDGLDSATGVKVKDLLPSGFTYVSDNSASTSTTYTSSTGIWDVGTIANGNSKALELVGSLQTSGSYTNVAEVIDAGTYDTDSALGSGQGDTRDQFTVTTPNPNVNAAADVIVSGPSKTSATSKAVTVKITNVGTVNFTTTQSDIDATVNGSSVVTCSPFSQVIKPGRSYRAKCSANLSILGLSPGDPVNYIATIDVPADGFTNNDSSIAQRVAS